MGSDLDFNRMYAIYVAISFFPLKTALTNKKKEGGSCPPSYNTNILY